MFQVIIVVCNYCEQERLIHSSFWKGKLLVGFSLFYVHKVETNDDRNIFAFGCVGQR